MAVPERGHTAVIQLVIPLVCRKDKTIKTRKAATGAPAPKHSRFMIHVQKPYRHQDPGLIGESVYGRVVCRCPTHRNNTTVSYHLNNYNLGDFIHVSFRCGCRYLLRNDFKGATCVQGDC